MGAAAPPRRSLTNNGLLGGTPCPPSRWARANGGCPPRRCSLGSDRLFGGTPRLPSRWARADGGCRPPQVLSRQRPPPGRDSPSPQQVGPR